MSAVACACIVWYVAESKLGATAEVVTVDDFLTVGFLTVGGLTTVQELATDEVFTAYILRVDGLTAVDGFLT